MKRENLNKAIELGEELKSLEMCRDLIYGGSKVNVMNYHGEQFYLPTTDLNMRARIIAAIKTRIEEINKEIEEL